MNCTKCQEDKPLTEFPKYKGKTGRVLRRHKCKTCYSKEHHARIYNDPEKRAKKQAYDKRWRHENCEKMKQYRARQKHNQRRCHERRRDNLEDAYVLGALGLREAPKELIEAKRLQIQIIRKLKERCYEKRCPVTGRFI